MEGQTASLKFDFVWNTAANQDPITVWRRVQAKHGRAQLLLSRHFRYVERLKNNDWSGRKRGADWKSECQYNIPPRVRRFLLSWQARIPLAARTSYKSFLDLLLLSLTVAFWSYFFYFVFVFCSTWSCPFAPTTHLGQTPHPPALDASLNLPAFSRERRGNEGKRGRNGVKRFSYRLYSSAQIYFTNQSTLCKHGSDETPLRHTSPFPSPNT